MIFVYICAFIILFDVRKNALVLNALKDDLNNSISPTICSENSWWDDDVSDGLTRARALQMKTIESRNNIEQFGHKYIMFTAVHDANNPLDDNAIYADQKYTYAGKDKVISQPRGIYASGVKSVKLKALKIIHKPNKIIFRFSHGLNILV